MRSRFVFPGDVQRTAPQGATRPIRQPDLEIGLRRWAMLAGGAAGVHNMEVGGNPLHPALQQLQQHAEERARLNRLAVPDLLPGLGSFQPLGQKVTNLGTDGPAVRIQRDAFHAGPV